jgi:hypothetical protein
LMLPKMLQDALQTAQTTHTVTNENPFDRIKKLKELLDLGAISIEEYEGKRKKLLEEI